METTLCSYLIGQAAVSALIGTRMYPLTLPQKVAYPAVTYQLISAPRAHTKAGPTGSVRSRIQIDCWALDYDEARGLARKIRDAAATFLGTQGAFRIASVSCEDELDWYDSEAATPVFRRTLDFVISH